MFLVYPLTKMYVDYTQVGLHHCRWLHLCLQHIQGLSRDVYSLSQEREWQTVPGDK